MKRFTACISLITGILSLHLGSASADIIVHSGAELKVAGSVTTGTVQTAVDSKISGTGTINGFVTGAGDFSPGTTGFPYGTLVFNGAVATSGSYLCDLSSTSLDRMNVATTLDISNMVLVLPADPGNLTEAIYLISSYGTLSGASFAGVQNSPPGYKVVYAYDNGGGAANIALVKLTAFESWAAELSLPPGQDGVDDDPNGDGVPNIAHFAFNTDPLGDGSDEGKTRLVVEEVGGTDYLTITLPIRNGATFSGSPLTSNLIDDLLIYSILGDTDLKAPWDLPVVEVVPALDTGLPVTGVDWEYRSFRLSDPFSDLPRAFIRVGVTTSP